MPNRAKFGKKEGYKPHHRGIDYCWFPTYEQAEYIGNAFVLASANNISVNEFVHMIPTLLRIVGVKNGWTEDYNESR